MIESSYDRGLNILERRGIGREGVSGLSLSGYFVKFITKCIAVKKSINFILNCFNLISIFLNENNLIDSIYRYIR